MLHLHEGMKLYHGSSVVVSQPDLAKCSPHKDFGRGFYLTSSIEQARDFARIVAIRTIKEDVQDKAAASGFVSVFELAGVKNLDTIVYETADAEWLHCVVAHRRGEPFVDIAKDLADVDVIVGKVANDQTNATILAYIAGAYGKIGSESADAFCISLLLPERLNDQACFRTSRALNCLKYCDCEEICL